MSFCKQNLDFVRRTFPSFTTEEYDLLRKCAFMLIHKTAVPELPDLYVNMAIQYLCSLILQHENLTELENENKE